MKLNAGSIGHDQREPLFVEDEERRLSDDGKDGRGANKMIKMRRELSSYLAKMTYDLEEARRADFNLQNCLKFVTIQKVKLEVYERYENYESIAKIKIHS